MIEKINELKAEIENLTAGSPQEVEQLRIKYLSKKGLVTSLFSEFRDVPADQKKELGQKLNELKTLATHVWASLWPKGRKSKMTGTCSRL